MTVSTQMTSRRVVGAVEPKSAAPPAKKKFGLVLQAGGALGAYEVGAIKYLYERRRGVRDRGACPAY